MYRLILAGAIIILTSYLGYKMRGFYQKRYDIMLQILELLEYMYHEIRYKLTPFSEMLSSFGKKDITEIFVQPYLSKASYTDTIITDEEYTHLAKLCDSLRVMDRNECLSLLNEELDRYRKSVEVAKHKLEKDGALDLKISVLIGIAIAIMVL